MYLKCWTCRVQTGVREECGWLVVMCGGGGGGGYPIHLQCIYISYFQLRAAELVSCTRNQAKTGHLQMRGRGPEWRHCSVSRYSLFVAHHHVYSVYLKSQSISVLFNSY